MRFILLGSSPLSSCRRYRRRRFAVVGLLALLGLATVLLAYLRIITTISSRSSNTNNDNNNKDHDEEEYDDRPELWWWWPPGGQRSSNHPILPYNDQTRGLLEIVLLSLKEEEGDRPKPRQWPSLSIPSYMTVHTTAPPATTTAAPTSSSSSPLNKLKKTNDHPPQHQGTNSTSTSCIVTAYFYIKHTKHDPRAYTYWMKNVLSLLDCMIIFCEPNMVDQIWKLRLGEGKGGKTVYRPTIVISMSLSDLPMAHYYYPHPTEANHTNMNQTAADSASMDFWQHQLYDLDPERDLHQSYEVFWIWLSKTWFVTTAILLLSGQQQFSSSENTANNLLNNNIDVWMWMDIGSFRHKGYNNKQLIQYADDVLVDNNTLIWMSHNMNATPPTEPLWNKKLQQPEHFYHAGSHGIGTRIAWLQYYVHFVHVLDEYAKHGKFIGDDQCVLQMTCLKHPENCAYLSKQQIPDPGSYFALRHALHYGPTKVSHFRPWRPSSFNVNDEGG